MNQKLSCFVLVTSLAALGAVACASADDGGGAEASSQTDMARVLTRTEQVAVIERRLAATNSRDWDTWESLHTPDAVRTAPELEAPLQGAAAMRLAIETLGNAFPDYHLELRQAFGEGEWLALKLHTTGTMTGPLVLSDGSEVPPTGRKIEQDWSALVRFEGDKIAEFDEFYDQLTLMVELGLVEE